MLKLTPIGTIQMVVSDGVYSIQGNNKKMLDGDGCLYTDTYCFHGHYVFDYGKDILLGNFYYAPTNTASNGSFNVSFPAGTIIASNLTGAYWTPSWFADLCVILAKKPYSVKFSVCKGSRANSTSGTEQSHFLTNGSFNSAEYSLGTPAPAILGDKVTSVTGASITGNNSQVVVTHTNHESNNYYYSIYVSITA